MFSVLNTNSNDDWRKPKTYKILIFAADHDLQIFYTIKKDIQVFRNDLWLCVYDAMLQLHLLSLECLKICGYLCSMF